MEMATDSTSWLDITRIDTTSTTDTIKTYKFSDYPSGAANYGYRLEICLDDTPRVFLTFAIVQAWALTGVESSSNQQVPTEFASVRCYPNPFNPTTTIEVTLQSAERGSTDIYDLRGRKIECLVDGSLHQGILRYQWDGTSYPSGTYFCVLQTHSRVATAKLPLQK
jgi:hypothetical protein